MPGAVGTRMTGAQHWHWVTLDKLQDLFGDQLDNPDARFELALVLRARHAGQQRPGDSS